MKNLLILSLSLVTLTLSYANSANPIDDNEEYLASVRDAATPAEIVEVQNMVSAYDATRAEGFEGRNEPFKTVFRMNKGTINAEYDENGELLRATEEFNNVRLPVAVRNTLFNAYGEGWEMVNNTYTVQYERGQDTEIFYTVKMRNGNKKERIRIDSDLNLTRA
jgi:hypothetical protein